MRGSNLSKIVTSLEEYVKKWFSETVALYEIKTKAKESDKAVTLAKLAQTFLHVTTYFFKQGVARTFGVFPVPNQTSQFSGHSRLFKPRLNAWDYIQFSQQNQKNP